MGVETTVQEAGLEGFVRLLGDIMGWWETSTRSWRRWVDSDGCWFGLAVGGLGRWEMSTRWGEVG